MASAVTGVVILRSSRLSHTYDDRRAIVVECVELKPCVWLRSCRCGSRDSSSAIGARVSRSAVPSAQPRQATAGAPADRRRGGAAGAREQPRHPDRADRSADRGSERRAGARPPGRPTFTTTLQATSTDSPNNSFLSGARAPRRATTGSTPTSASSRRCRGAARYSVGWDSSRSTTTNIFSNFSPQLRSSLALTYAQPLLRGFSIDTSRQQLLRQSEEPRDRRRRRCGRRSRRRRGPCATRTGTWPTRSRRWRCSSSRSNWRSESLRNTRARVEIGTTPPIDIVEAEAEVAPREEAVIVGEGADRDRRGHRCARSSTTRHRPTSGRCASSPPNCPPFQPTPIDVDGAVRNALERRTDLQQSRKTLEATDINIRFFRNQTLPDVTASFDYGLTGLGGTQFLRGRGLPRARSSARAQRSFGSVLGDLFGNDFPSWTASLNVSYPLGPTPAGGQPRARAPAVQPAADAARRTRAAGRDAGARSGAAGADQPEARRRRRRVSRELAERRLEAEQRKFAAGTSTSFLVFQAQRDLAQARNNELRAILDYHRVVVDFETVPGGAAQIRPVRRRRRLR